MDGYIYMIIVLFNIGNFIGMGLGEYEGIFSNVLSYCKYKYLSIFLLEW